MARVVIKFVNNGGGEVTADRSYTNRPKVHGWGVASLSGAERNGQEKHNKASQGSRRPGSGRGGSTRPAGK